MLFSSDTTHPSGSIPLINLAQVNVKRDRNSFGEAQDKSSNELLTSGEVGQGSGGSWAGICPNLCLRCGDGRAFLVARADDTTVAESGRRPSGAASKDTIE